MKQMVPMPEKMNPTLHLDVEDVTSLSTVELGDLLTLTVKGRITGLHEE